MTLLEARDLTAGHHGRPAVLHGARFILPPGGRVALLGANGSGKTTLLRCLSAAHQPSGGQVLRGGVPLTWTRAARQEHRRHVQLVLQDPDDQLFSADVTADVSFGPLNLGLDAAAAAERVARALDALSISHLAERPTHQLSYGERKRVALAGAVAMRPGVVLLDEPTAGLDPVGVAEVRAILDRLHADGTGLVVATHDVDFALAWADEAAVVAGGTITQGPSTAVLADVELLASARLEEPAALRLVRLLGLPERPRTVDQAAALIAARTMR